MVGDEKNKYKLQDKASLSFGGTWLGVVWFFGGSSYTIETTVMGYLIAEFTLSFYESKKDLE